MLKGHVNSHGDREHPRAERCTNRRHTQRQLGRYLDRCNRNFAAIDIDEEDGHTFRLVSDSSFNPVSSPFDIVGSNLIVVDRSLLVLGEKRVLTVEVKDDAGSIIRQVYLVTVDEIFPTVGVAEMVTSASGASVTFTDPIDLSVLNLYDGVDASVDLPDVTLVGSTTGNVAGSLLWNAATKTLEFLKTGGPLVPDNYTLTLHSRADGIRSQAGILIDGDADGVPGGNYVRTFSVGASTARVVSIADFSRGATSTAGQAVNIGFDNGTVGIPITINDASGALAIDLDVVYDPQLLTVSSALNTVLPAGWSTAVNLIGNNRVRLTMSGTTPLAAGTREIARLVASVPANAPYGSSNRLTIENLAVYTQAGGATAVPSVADPGIHKAIFVGDTNADGIYSAQDAAWVASVRVGLTSGFDAYSWTDPVILADVTRNGSIDGLDSSWLSRKGLSPTLQPEIPNLPAGSLPIPAGIDPTIAADLLVPGSAGGIVNLPIRITDNAQGLWGVDVFLNYNTLLLDLPNGLNAGSIQLAGMFLNEGGWTIDTFVDESIGLAKLSMYRVDPSTSTAVKSPMLPST